MYYVVLTELGPADEWRRAEEGQALSGELSLRAQVEGASEGRLQGVPENPAVRVRSQVSVRIFASQGERASPARRSPTSPLPAMPRVRPPSVQ